MKIRIASRESRLALWQAEHVRDLLLGLTGKSISEVDIVGMTTKGDRILDRSLSKIGGKGLFIKELEVALLENRADLAVHSGKDIPMELDPEFELLGFLTRETPTDAFVSNDFESLDQLPAGAVVGTSSLRRQAQVLARFPHLKVQPLRGNLDTRLGKLDVGQYQAIVLATAGLKRMNMHDRIRAEISPEQMLPAVGQGALGLEIRRTDSLLKSVLQPLINPVHTQLVMAERFISRALGGSCQVPIAGYATLVEPSSMHLRGLVATTDGRTVLQFESSGPLGEWEAVAQRVVRQLIDAGAQAIVNESVNDQP